MLKILFQIFKTPYLFAVLVILLIIILCILFHKRIKSLLENVNLHISKANTLNLGISTNAQNSKKETAIEINNVEVENSCSGEIEGNVSINNVKIKNSTIGSVRGK